MPGDGVVNDRRRERIASVIGEVLRQAVRDAGAAGILVLDDGSPEARLVLEWSVAALGESAVRRAGMPTAAQVGAALPALAPDAPGAALEELHRCRARLIAREHDLLLAHPANKTAGGIGPVDAALQALLEERRTMEYALAHLDDRAGAAVRDALAAGRFARRRVGLVPKLGTRTLGIDLFA